MRIFQKFKARCRAVIRTVNLLDIEKSERFFVFWDIIYCKLRFKCLYDEYVLYRLYKYNNRYRKKFLYMMTRRKLYGEINVNCKGCLSKTDQRDMIKVGLNRAMIRLPDCGAEAFLEFARKHGKMVVKPDAGSCGLGVKLFVYENDEQAREYFSGIKIPTLCEEFIRQHEEMSKLHPASVNTIRVLALCDGENVNFLSAVLRVGGREDSVADNMQNNGLGAAIDIPTGIVKTFGHDLQYKAFAYHPVTGAQIIGFRIPKWAEVLSTIEKAHKQIPDYPLLGWDVAITEDGVEIVEINRSPGSRIVQIMDQEPKGPPLFRYIKAKKKKK